MSSLKEWSGIGTGCPVRWWPYPCGGRGVQELCRCDTEGCGLVSMMGMFDNFTA